jgi:hypothetical protein
VSKATAPLAITCPTPAACAFDVVTGTPNRRRVAGSYGSDKCSTALWLAKSEFDTFPVGRCQHESACGVTTLLQFRDAFAQRTPRDAPTRMGCRGGGWVPGCGMRTSSNTAPAIPGRRVSLRRPRKRLFASAAPRAASPAVTLRTNVSDFPTPGRRAQVSNFRHLTITENARPAALS